MLQEKPEVRRGQGHRNHRQQEGQGWVWLLLAGRAKSHSFWGRGSENSQGEGHQERGDVPWGSAGCEQQGRTLRDTATNPHQPWAGFGVAAGHRGPAATAGTGRGNTARRHAPRSACHWATRQGRRGFLTRRRLPKLSTSEILVEKKNKIKARKKCKRLAEVFDDCGAGRAPARRVQPQQAKLSVPLVSCRLCLFSSRGSQQ